MPTEISHPQVFKGAASPPLYESILSMGHVHASRLNAPESEELHFYPERDKLKQNVIAFTLMASVVLVPYFGVKAIAKVNQWQAESQAAERAERLEAESKAAAVRREAEDKLAQAAAAERQAAMDKAPAILAGFVDRGVANTALAATPASALLNDESMRMWGAAFLKIDTTTKGPDFTQKLEAGVDWTKPVQYRTLSAHMVLVTAVVDDAGARKVWVGLMYDKSFILGGAPQFVASVAGIPGVDQSKLYLAPEVSKLDFSKVQKDYVAAMVPAAPAASPAASQVYKP